MDKCWYYIIEGGAIGPYTLDELKDQPGFNPDSLVWKEGFQGWTLARDVKELEALFEDEETPTPIEEVEEEKKPVESEGDVAVVEGKEPPFMFLWLLFVVIVLIYLFLQFLFNG